MLARFEPDKRDEYAMEAARCFAELGWPFHRAVTLEIAEIPSEARQIYVNIGATAEAERLRGDAPPPSRPPHEPNVVLNPSSDRYRSVYRTGQIKLRNSDPFGYYA